LVVSNTSPLVYLAALGDFVLLRDLFAEIVIPGAVLQEIKAGGAGLPVAYAVETAMASWLSARDVTDVAEASRLRQSGLHGTWCFGSRCCILVNK